jgi:hypothetical protein
VSSSNRFPGEFDPVAHEYFVRGVRRPGVTRTLSAEGLVDDSWFTPEGAERGRHVHKACHLWRQGTLDEETVDETIMPYLDGFKKFVTQSGFIILESEIKLYSEIYDFAGTVDIIGHFPDEDFFSIIDIKSGATLQRWVALQTAAYHILWDDPTAKRFALQLFPTSRYRLHEYKDRNDRNIYLAANALYRWKRAA